MYPALLNIKGFVLSSHDFFLSLGFLFGTLFLIREVKRENEDTQKLLDLAIYEIIVTLVGARLFHVIIEAPEFYIKHPLNILMIWNGGWTFYGGLLAGIIFGVFYLKKHRLNVLRSTDIFAPAISLGLMFGRTACLMAGCCYGKPCPTDFPLGMTFNIVNRVRPQAEPLGIPLYPTQAIEAFVAIFLFFFLIFYRPKKRFHGELSAIALIVYSIVRFFVEFLRADDIRGLWFGGALSTSQILSLPLFLTGAWIIFKKNYYLASKGTK